MDVIIREYEKSDEYAWLICRLEAFIDSSYFDDVKTRVEVYKGETISLVAECGGRLVGFVEAEIDSDSLQKSYEGRGAVLWNLGVIKAYRNLHIASMLWKELLHRLKCAKVAYCEVWTQQDEPANGFYQNAGFSLVPSKNWLRCRISGKRSADYLNASKVEDIYGVEEIILEAPTEQLKKWQEVCSRIDEVRLYAIKF